MVVWVHVVFIHSHRVFCLFPGTTGPKIAEMS